MADRKDDKALEEHMRDLLSSDDAAMAEFGASDAACILYPGEDQQAERAAFCRGAGYDHVRISALTRKLEEAKGALEWYASAEAWTARELESSYGDYGTRARMALASLSPEQPEKPEADRRHGIYDMPDGSRWHSGTGEVTKPEAVETGEPVAWRVRLLPQFSDAEWFLTQHKHEAYSYGSDYEVQPLYPSPVSDGEAK